ncbi:TonB-dependent receptor [Novosphingobium sp. KACC 22771]|uniref:TonB-dependent receptor n=1 Tax=Novosphingobium sp. KACC 22771 TaxID=3025670 RepID=UPI0023666BAE|nr:TonB-dependent receptor [Novosphingobium sp. KACC 22771]WDF72545.1 TonB-dependent receptor [Novosphingobium sp. KACC 22771]
MAARAAWALGLLTQSPLCPAAEADARTYAMTDIVVTATKRPERAQDVPTSMWAVSAEMLQRQQVRDFDDLARVDPALSITKTTQPGNNSINIRGIGTYAFSIATKPSVSVVIDDVPQAFQAQAFRELADIASIEVLRGPQSTLFGTAATAGLVNIKTAEPTARWSGGMRSSLTSDRERRIGGYLSGPLSENLLFRVAVSANDYRGNLFNIYNATWVGGQSGVDVRGKLVWRPTGALTITAAPYFDRSASTCCTAAIYALSPDVTFGTFGGKRIAQTAILNGITPGPDNRLISADINPRGRASEAGGSLKAEWIAGAYTLTSITGYADYSLQDLQDTDGTAFDWGPNGAAVPGAVAGGSANGGWFKVRSLTQELKLTSPATGRFRFLAGFFFSRVRSQRSFVRGSNTLEQDGTLAVVPPTTSAFSDYTASAFDTNYALYGQSSFDLTPRLGIVTGLRINRDEMGYQLTDRFNRVSFGIPACSATAPSGLAISTCNTFDAVSGRAALEYRPAAGVMVFAGYDRGYKGAAYDLSSTYTMRGLLAAGPLKGYPIADAVAAKQPISAETVDALQLGVKANLTPWLIGNISLYQQVFHDFQAQSRDETTRQNVLNSIPRVTSRGVEMELRASLPGLMLSAQGAYNDARMSNFPNANCFSSQTAALGCIGGQQDLSGKVLPNAPAWKFSINAVHERRIGHDLTLALTGNWMGQSSIVQSLLQDPNSIQPAYGLLGMGIEIRSPAKSLGIYVSNLLDTSYALNRSRDGNWNINPYAVLPGPVSDAIKWTPGRDSTRYIRAEFSAHF